MMTALWQRHPAGRASMHWSSTSGISSHPPRPASSTLSMTLLQKAQILSGATPSLGGKDRPQPCLMVSIPSSTIISSMPHQHVCLDGDNHALNVDSLSGTQLPPLDNELYKVLQLHNLFTSISLARPANVSPAYVRHMSEVTAAHGDIDTAV